MNRPITVKPLASPIANRTSQPKELTREELRERSAKGLCWHCSEPWSRDHRCKRGKLLVIESIEDPEPEDVDPKPEREDAEEEPQPAIGTIHALAGYANPQYMKVDGFLEHQPITIHIDTGSTNNFMDGKIREPQRRRELIRHRRRNNPPIDQGIREDGDKPSDSTANRVSPESPKVRNNKRKKSKSVSLARQSPQRNSDEGAKMRRRRQKSRA
ncbi:hypothetical protein BHM03_00034719 [Ensete ventricosum]|nr:hypothetical protein BHM03_00034719 [Ensete ventricosum]